MNTATTAPVTKSTVATRIMALVQHPQMRTIKTAAELDARLIGLGLTRDCSRCGGSGNYGPQCVDGGRCFKCRGRRVLAAKLSKALEVEARALVERGDLDRYVARRLEIAAAKRAAKGIWDDAIQLYAATAWYQYFHVTHQDRSGRNGGALHNAVYQLHRPAYKIGDEIDRDIRLGYGTEEAAERLIAAKAEYVEALARMDRVHELALARGLYDVSTTELLAVCEHDGKPRYYDLRRANDKRWREVAEALWIEVG